MMPAHFEILLFFPLVASILIFFYLIKVKLSSFPSCGFFRLPSTLSWPLFTFPLGRAQSFPVEVLFSSFFALFFRLPPFLLVQKGLAT